MGNLGDAGVFARDAGTWKVPSDLQARNAGVWANVSEVWARKDGTWQKVWERNTAPQPVAGLAVTFVANGFGWDARANWTLSSVDTDRANVYVRWTLGGVVGAWTPLGAAITTNTVDVTSGATATVEVYVLDTGGLVSPTVTAAGGASPLDAPTLTVTQVGYDRIRATWVAPAGTVNSYDLTIDQPTAAAYSDPATSTFREFVVAHGVAYNITIKAKDSALRVSPTRSATGTITAAAIGALSHTTTGTTQVNLSWVAAANSPTYEVEQAVGAAGFAVIGTTTGTTLAVTVNQDTQYRYRVRPRGTTYYGSYSNEARPSMGHAAYSFTQAYSLSKSGCQVYLGHPDGPTPPAGQGISLAQMTVSVTPSFTTSLSSGTATRDLYFVDNGVQGYPTGTKPAPWNETFSFLELAPNGGIQGLAAQGAGWGSQSTSSFILTGTITVAGTQVINVAAVANTTW